MCRLQLGTRSLPYSRRAGHSLEAASHKQASLGQSPSDAAAAAAAVAAAADQSRCAVPAS